MWFTYQISSIFVCLLSLFLVPRGDSVLIVTEPVQIGTPVTSVDAQNNRRLLQFTCPTNMIMQDSQCVCAQNYFSSVSLQTVAIANETLLCTGITDATNLAASCGASLCPTYSNINWQSYASPVNTITYKGDGFQGTALSTGDSWYRLDMLVVKAIGGGKIRAYEGGPTWADTQPGLYQIWIGNTPTHYSAPGNHLCFTATNIDSFKSPPYYNSFTCSYGMGGRYLFVARAPASLPMNDLADFGFMQIYVYPPAQCEPVPNCLACPNSMKSLPGSLSETDCFVYNALQVNFTVDDADQYLNETAFRQGLPDGVTDLLYDDQVVVYVETCPTGYFCISDTTIPTACPAGTFRDTPGAERQSDCLVCPVGYYCPIATTTPTQCAAGTYRGSVGAKQPTDCTACDTGNYCIQGSVDPVNCTAGTYRATAGAQALIDCLVCPVGEYCGIATTTPTPCAAGTYRGSTSGVTQDDCLVCPEGFYCPLQSVTPTQCPAGTYGNQTGASLLSQCKTCLVGSYCPISSIVPTPCEAGTYRETIGAIEQPDCDTCPTGYYCPERSVTPTACPAGTYFNNTHGTQDTNCQPCDPGTYCPIASTLPTSCPAGYFRDQSGGTQLSSCYICPTGQFCPIRTVVPTSCLPGTYRATTGASQISDCLLCPEGQYCPFATTVPVHCPIGTYRGTTGGEDRFSCTECPTGNYCPEQSVAPVNCSSGTYRPVPGGGAVEDCIPCPTGEYCSLATTTPIPCPSGTYRDTEGATIVGECVVCPVAHYCPMQTTTPYKCAPGTYRSTTGAHQQSDCPICPTGNYCPEMSTTPTDCPITTYRGVEGATSLPDCVPCPAGLYCPLETTTPVPCAAGTFRSYPSAGAQIDCPTCPVGSYCPLQTVTPIKCRAGTHRDATGASQLSQCLLCQPGTYSLIVGRSSNCPLCDPNFYCRTSTTKDVCPLHTTSSAGSYSRVNCLCDPGYQCTYYKQIQAVVTLNATLWEFNNDINGVRTAFIAAMAAAAGVHPSYVTINEVMAQGRRRRLLSIENLGAGDSQETINVHASVTGAVKLRDLDKHLNRHSATLHISHRWVQAPQIHAMAISGPSAPTTRRMAKAQVTPPKPLNVPLQKHAPSQPTLQDKMMSKERLKSRSIKLVNKEFLNNMLNQV